MINNCSKLLILNACLLLVHSCSRDCSDYSIKNPEGHGCGNFLVFDVYTANACENCYLYVQFDIEKAGLDQDFKMFSVQGSSLVMGGIESYNMNRPPYCNDDIPFSLRLLNSWTLQSGEVSARVAQHHTDCETYLVDLILQNAVFRDSTGNEIAIESQYFHNVIVGWYSG